MGITTIGKGKVCAKLHSRFGQLHLGQTSPQVENTPEPTNKMSRSKSDNDNTGGAKGVRADGLGVQELRGER